MTDDKWSLPPLTLDDRCDRCGAAASHRIVLVTGDLYLCQHHYNACEDELMGVAIYIHDDAAPALSDVDMEPVGRMHMRRGLTHADPCRWCTRRLVNRRTLAPETHIWHEYFVCEHCDCTADPDMDSLKGLTV